MVILQKDFGIILRKTCGSIIVFIIVLSYSNVSVVDMLNYQIWSPNTAALYLIPVNKNSKFNET